jgi:carboxymethylenebutenolidase
MSSRRVSFPGHGGGRVDALLATPDAAGGDRPNGLLLIHEVFGLDEHMQGLARRLAREGFAVLAPDLYSREGLPGPASSPADPAPVWSPETIRAAVAALPDRRVLADLGAALAFLGGEGGADPQHLCALGFCLGGTYALMLGCASSRLAAAVDFYGRIRYGELSASKPIQPLELLLNLSCPLLAIFGARDASIPPGDVEELRARLEQFGKTSEVRVFAGAGHGFFNETRGRYDEPASRQAWELTLGFLREALESQDERPPD